MRKKRVGTRRFVRPVEPGSQLLAERAFEGYLFGLNGHLSLRLFFAKRSARQPI